MLKDKYIYQFIPENLKYLNDIKSISFKDTSLKTSYLINIIHELILKYYFSTKNELNDKNEIEFNLWSSILRKKYGMHYNLYMDYLIDIGFISLVSNYYVGKKSKTYKINNLEIDKIKKVRIYDNILLKKNSKEYLIQSITSYCNSSIEPKIRKKLIDDLYHVNIDYDKSINLINNLKNNSQIDINKYYKNLHSIESIKNNNIFFKFDEYGRLHTNFTTLKKEIRQNYITIDDQDITEIDIKNSQPFFLGLLINNELLEKNDEIDNYIWLVKEGLLYEHISSKNNNIDRNAAKVLMYKVLFGYNNDNLIENKIFNSFFPSVYQYIKEYKTVNNDYKSMSHTLQRMESDFIFGKVIKEIYENIPEIKLITIHDSIIYPLKYEKEVTKIFNRNKKELF